MAVHTDITESINLTCPAALNVSITALPGTTEPLPVAISLQ